MFMIMMVATVVTLMILPALITGFPWLVFGNTKVKTVCSCGKCILMAIIIAGTVAYILLGYNLMNLNSATIICLVIVVVLSGTCAIISRQKICKDRRI
jgi:phosphate/sulfate permease